MEACYGDECMVSVICSTYNQIKYIRQCLDSLVTQKTTFKYEVIVKDDASTDGQREIILEYANKYPDIIRPLLLEENHFQKGLGSVAFEKAFKMAQGKYIAGCEGDDFWVDENKLQVQVDFMEDHPDYVLCGHAAYYANEDGTLQKDRFFRFDTVSRDISTEEIISDWAMATNSLLYRKESRTDIIIPFQGKCVSGDYAKTVYLALKGKIYYFDKLMSAYRVNSIGSISRLYKDNKEKQLEFAAMLDRINEYTKGQYEAVINNYKRRYLFYLYLRLADRKELLKYKDQFKGKPLKTKIKYVACVYFTPLYKIYLKNH